MFSCKGGGKNGVEGGGIVCGSLIHRAQTAISDVHERVSASECLAGLRLLVSCDECSDGVIYGRHICMQ